MLGREEISACKVEGLVVRRPDKRAHVDLPRVYARDNIPCRRDQIPTPEVADKWLHLRKIKDKIPPCQADLQIGLLIGCNCPKAIKPKEVISGKGEEPYAVRTLLGWCIVGPVASASESTDNVDIGPSTCNCIATREVLPEARLGPTFALNTSTKEEINPSVVKQLFELDFSEKHSSNLSLSRDNRKFLEIVKQGIHQLDNNHYELPLPLKDGNINLPNNRDVAVRRMNHLKRKFERDPTQNQEDYVAFMGKLLRMDLQKG
ncbi:uncharacterized protein LOC114518573 [Dendronephthya gigantea]|uniref:uncharacterized protein LOC114518573 n=1 Tax=Dendronephthya gigantea TaxID=151771 RepID=UPI00106DC550|nr:uncharacterized protein LOC114518573 [Dendronephthya gigantea]